MQVSSCAFARPTPAHTHSLTLVTSRVLSFGRSFPALGLQCLQKTDISVILFTIKPPCEVATSNRAGKDEPCEHEHMQMLLYS